MAKALKKMRARRDLRRAQHDAGSLDRRPGFARPGSMKKKAKSAGKVM